MELFLVIFSYLLGSVMTGYLVSKLVAGKDIRQMGSLNVGARNAGTLFGKKAFFITAIGDGLKGLLAVLLAKSLGFSVGMQALILLVVLLGHLYPIFLKFHGGKGIATFIGALLMFNFELFIYFLGAFLVLVVISRSATLAVMGAFVFIPFVTFYLSVTIIVPLMMTIAIVLLLWASRNNIVEKFSRQPADDNSEK